MPIRVPPLDERKFQDLVAEALARVPVHAPEWTNFQRSDPGVTLVELFAFLTESLLYRANQIPERNRLKFLSLLGVPLAPATSARALLTFANERGPLAVHALLPGVEARAGAVPFLTERGVDVLPIEARPFYKLDVTDLAPEAQAYYAQLHQATLEDRGSPPARFYRAVPLDRPAPDGVDLGATVDQSLWIALLARPRESPEAARRLIAGRTLALAWVPTVLDDPRAPAVVGAPGASARFVYELPWVDVNDTHVPQPGGLRTPRYRALQALESADLRREPGVVELALPPLARFGYWDDVEPLDAGVGEFPPSLEDSTLEARLITWLRVRVVGGASARVLAVAINSASATQRARVVGEALPEGTGEPDQTFTLARRPVAPGSVRLRVRPPGASSFEAWARVDDLLGAGPEVPTRDPRLPPGRVAAVQLPSKVFAVDAEAGELRFGDGTRGARVPQGAAMVVDYDVSAGAAGNVAEGAIRSAAALPPGLTVSNLVPSWGGADAESVEQGERHVARYLQHRDRLVTAEDFKTITLRTPGVAIGRVEVLPAQRPVPDSAAVTDAPGALTVMVVPRFDARNPDAPEADAALLNAVCAWLEPRRLVTTEVFLRGPTYVDFAVSVGIEVVPGASARDVREAVARALREFFSPLPTEGAAGLEEPSALLAAPTPSFLQVRRGWPLRKAVVALEVQAVVSRVKDVLLVREVLLGVAGSTSSAASRTLQGVELPRLGAFSVVEGDPLPLTQMQGGPTTPREAFPVPVVPEVCG
jgi:hypothetical protein